MTAREFICPQAAIEHDAYIRHALLLKFIGIELVHMARAGAPVDGAWRITRLIFADAEEICPRAACLRRNHSCVDARPARADGDLTDTCHRREDEQTSLRRHPDR